MEVLNKRPHGALLHDGILYPAGTPVTLDEEKYPGLGEKLAKKGSVVRATAANVKAAEDALAEDEEEVQEADSTTGEVKVVRRKKTKK